MVYNDHEELDVMQVVLCIASGTFGIFWDVRQCITWFYQLMNLLTLLVLQCIYAG